LTCVAQEWQRGIVRYDMRPNLTDLFVTRLYSNIRLSRRRHVRLQRGRR
jgi:hypothetical protein